MSYPAVAHPDHKVVPIRAVPADARGPQQPDPKHPAVIGTSQAIRAAIELSVCAAESNCSVLITGETGTGKEVFAQDIHRRSKRFRNPFVAINCAALPKDLVESELFGHTKGAFTGAVVAKPGLIVEANGGTLMLDEIAEMDSFLQAKLLRFLQERTFRMLGASAEIKADIRVIAATNVDVDDAVSEGRLRADLYYRLNVIRIDLPPLRDRPEDIPQLARHFLSWSSARNNKFGLEFSDDAIAFLCEQDWPGNIRELMAFIERAVIVCWSHEVTIDNLSQHSALRRSPAIRSRLINLPSSGVTVEEIERELIMMTLKQLNGNRTAAAQQLGISPKTLHNKLNRYGRKTCANFRATFA